jgi:hypothetical protein
MHEGNPLCDADYVPHVLTLCAGPTIAQASLVCKMWYQVIQERDLWVELVNCSRYNKRLDFTVLPETLPKPQQRVVSGYYTDYEEQVTMITLGQKGAGKSGWVMMTQGKPHLVGCEGWDDIEDSYRRQIDGRIVETWDVVQYDDHWCGPNPIPEIFYEPWPSVWAIFYAVDSMASFIYACNTLQLSSETKYHPRVLVANKIDLPKEKWEVSRKQGVDKARECGVVYFELSALADVGVYELIDVGVILWERVLNKSKPGGKTQHGKKKQNCVMS